MALPPSCLAAVLSQFDYQANEVQREHLEVKVQGGDGWSTSPPELTAASTQC